MPDVGDRLLNAYVGLTRSMAPLGRLIVAARRSLRKEHAIRWRERLGIPGGKVDRAPTVWVHAASVGETIAILPLIGRLAGIGVQVVLTTVTTASARLVEKRLPAGVVHQFVPLDIAPYVDRFIRTWNPQLALFVESEIWPVAVQRLAHRNIPLIVLNGRMSARSFRGWQRVPKIAGAIFGRIRLCLAQSGPDADRFEALGVSRVVSVGNIKFDAPVPEAASVIGAALEKAIAGRPVFLAASTHEGEEDIVLDAFEQLVERIPDLLLVLAPRHPDRGADVMSLVVGRQFDVCQRSAGALPSRRTSVYVADTLGELGTLYRLSTVAFVGGSLVDRGGHNPIEPSRLGAAVVSGGFVRNFTEVYDALLADGAVTLVADAGELADAVEHLVRHTSARETQVEAAARVVDRYSGALERTWATVEPLVTPIVLAARLESRGGDV